MKTIEKFKIHRCSITNY